MGVIMLIMYLRDFF